jgi:hypothetical protein
MIRMPKIGQQVQIIDEINHIRWFEGTVTNIVNNNRLVCGAERVWISPELYWRHLTKLARLLQPGAIGEP